MSGVAGARGLDINIQIFQIPFLVISHFVHLGSSIQTDSKVCESFAVSPLQLPAALHDTALSLQLVSSFLFSRPFPVDAQAHVPLLL